MQRVGWRTGPVGAAGSVAAIEVHGLPTTGGLRLDSIRKSFGATPVLAGVSFELQPSEILGVIGPSGGGKSTLLRCINLLEHPDAGRLEFVGAWAIEFDVESAPTATRWGGSATEMLTEEIENELRRTAGMVFQGFNLWEERTVLENLILAPQVVLGRKRAEVVAEAEDLCRLYGLESKLDLDAWRLSGGQRQRVAIMRALMMKPKILLLDEITSALDPVLTVEVMQVIRELRAAGLAMIIVTHHLEFASSLCDRLLFLDQGRIIQIDPPDIMRHSPATPEVKRFLQILTAAR
jgi:ABC-type polar amino acid transport system ATPase subunit